MGTDGERMVNTGAKAPWRKEIWEENDEFGSGEY